MMALTCALAAGAVLSMLFANTRAVGIICLTILTFLFPIPMVALVLTGVGIYCFKRKRP